MKSIIKTTLALGAVTATAGGAMKVFHITGGSNFMVLGGLFLCVLGGALFALSQTPHPAESSEASIE